MKHINIPEYKARVTVENDCPQEVIDALKEMCRLAYQAPTIGDAVPGIPLKIVGHEPEDGISDELLRRVNTGLSNAILKLELENTKLRYGLELLITDYESIASRYLRSKAVKKEKKQQMLAIVERAKSLLNSEQNPERSVATEDQSGNKSL